jgi:hypothetical protein
MKSLYKSEFISSYWCQNRKLIYHKIHNLTVDDNELEKIKNKLTKVYLHLRTNDIKFYQIYQASDDVSLNLTHMRILTKFAQFLKSQDDIINNYCKGVSVIHDSKYVIKTVNYFIKLFGDKIPVKIVKDETDAYKFLNLKK